MSQRLPTDTDRMDGKDRWNVLILNLKDMERIVDKTYTSGELLREILPSDDVWRNVMDLENQFGVDFDFRVHDIDDYEDFVDAYLRSVVITNSDFEVKNKENFPFGKTGVAGHPDFIVDYTGEHETEHSGDKIYVEFKKNGDALRDSQFQWALDKTSNGFDVWLMWVKELD